MSHPTSENLRGTVIFEQSLKIKPLLHRSTYCGNHEMSMMDHTNGCQNASTGFCIVLAGRI
jgi:hypothetical protein